MKKGPREKIKADRFKNIEEVKEKPKEELPAISKDDYETPEG